MMRTLASVLAAAAIAAVPATAFADGKSCGSFLGLSLCHNSGSAAVESVAKRDAQSEPSRAKQTADRSTEKAAAKEAKKAERSETAAEATGGLGGSSTKGDDDVDLGGAENAKSTDVDASESKTEEQPLLKGKGHLHV